MKYDGTNLKEVLEAHKRWANKSDGWSGDDRAVLRGANLCGANLCRANLCEANLCGAVLRGANLCGANLCGADLRRAVLCGANLCGANLCGANLRRAVLRGANLCGAVLRGAKNIPFIPMECPDSGAFVAWKKCECYSKSVIVKLLVPEAAKRSSATARKCRCDKALVLEIQNLDGSKADETTAFSMYENSFAYTVGETVEPEEPFDDDRWNECASGIHFFTNRQDAVDY